MRPAADHRIRTSRWLQRAAVAVMLTGAMAIVPLAAAQASELNAALKSGKIGERYDGYLGIVEPPGSSDLRKLVESTNEKRKKKYTEIAKKNGLTAAKVAKQMAAKLAKRAKAGTYLMTKDEDWQKK